MAQTQKVLLYGNSLGIAALEASLSPVGGLTVARLDPHDSDLFSAVQAQTPDCLVFEVGALLSDVLIRLLTELPELDLIGIDLITNRLLVLSVRQHAEPNTADLVRVIQQQRIAA